MAVRLRPKFELRRMRPDDLEEVMVIERAAFRHPWSTELFRRELEHDWSTILVCVEPLTSAAGGRATERIVGFLIYWLVHDEVHILNVAVSAVFTVIFRLTGVQDGYDETRPADYVADPEPAPSASARGARAPSRDSLRAR